MKLIGLPGQTLFRPPLAMYTTPGPRPTRKVLRTTVIKGAARHVSVFSPGSLAISSLLPSSSQFASLLPTSPYPVTQHSVTQARLLDAKSHSPVKAHRAVGFVRPSVGSYFRVVRTRTLEAWRCRRFSQQPAILGFSAGASCTPHQRN